MTEDIQQIKSAAEAAKIAAQVAATAAEKAASVAFEASKNAGAVNTNIEYIKRDINEIKESLKAQTSCFITTQQHKEITDIASDHEKRIRVLETNMIRLITFGTAVIIVIQIIGSIIDKVIK